MSNSKAQLIYDDYTFNDNVKNTIKQWEGFVESGINYHFVGILGPQSSGKSTLLNLMFDCDYSVMDESEGRSQTTRGMWVSYDKSKKIVIMDVEGTDSVERGESHINFERKSSLFSLAMSEVLIINNNYMDIGRYSASNYDTLKTIFEIHLRLFHRPGSPKTKLLFVLRDVKQLTLMDKIGADLRQNIVKLWDSIEETSGAVGDKQPLDAYFTLEFVGLPHYHYENELFSSEAALLSSRFSDKTGSNYIFADEYKKQVPAEGFADYASQIWDQITQNKDLDLPSIQEMLAQLRCAEITKEAIQPLQAYCANLVDTKLSGKLIVPDLNTAFIRQQKEAIDHYKGSAALYQRKVYETKLAELESECARMYAPLKAMQLENISYKLLKESTTFVVKEIAGLMEVFDPSFWDKATLALDRLLARLSNEVATHLQVSLLDPSPQLVSTELEAVMQEVRPQVVESIKDRVSDHSSVLRMMKKCFDRSFKYDSHNIPREWESTDEIKLEFGKSCSAAHKALTTFSKAHLGGVNQAGSGNTGNTGNTTRFDLLTDLEIARLKEQFNEEVYSSYQDAVHSQKKSFSLHGIPPYVFAVIAILGFNEFLSFFKWIASPLNALLFVFMSFAGLGLYTMHNLGLLAPIQSVATQMGTSYVREAKTMLLNFFSDEHTVSNNKIEGLHKKHD